MLAVTSAGALGIGLAADSALHHYSPIRLEKVLETQPSRLRAITQQLKEFDGFAQALSLFNVLCTLLFIVAVLGLVDRGSVSTTAKVWTTIGLFTMIGFVFYGLVRGVAAQVAEAVLLRLLGFITLVHRLMYPLAAPLNAACVLLGRAFGAKPSEISEEDEAMEEILDAVAESEAGGALQESTAHLIENLIEFKDLVVREIMTPRTTMVCIRQSAAIEDVLRIVGQHGHSRYPIYTENRDNIVGMLYVLDLFKHYDKVRRGETSLAAIMRKPLFVPETKRVDDLLQELRANKVHIAVVLDEFGGTAGLVTVQDIVVEIVGDLEDEFGKGKRVREIHRVDDNRVEIDAKLPLEDLNEQLALDIPVDSGYETVGGFLAAALGKVPSKGENVVVDGVRFEVVDADERRAKRVRVTMSANR